MKEKREWFSILGKKARDIMNGQLDRDEKLKAICKFLGDNVSYYDWVGFYIVDQTREKELKLGPFEGEPTEHTRIPFGRGICGQAAEIKKTFVVQDVAKQINYLSCSPKVKSEIVVPIFKNRKIVGELDVDSYTHSPFTDEDKNFLEAICETVSNLF